MSKSKMTFIIVILAITLMGCSQNKEGTFLLGNITEINDKSGNMEIEIEGSFTVDDAESLTELYEFEKQPKSLTIRVSNPKEYEEGQKVQAKVIKKYEEDVWDLDKLEFEVEEVT
ncbi:hypothetical protein [Halobacillus trueperi]|uniref:S1 motif domain-containing protein n=1 Tax=Halobacillus trueperi TaxID=156205 RepID=A0A3E0J5G6_9BACI|nr:hypothetical protein [Halobacillus trueperi]REJ07954.1 hypothetical protein DYE48_15035 [Halobacillus trueperi]